MPGPVVVRDLSAEEANQLKVIFEGEGASVVLVPSDSGKLTLVATYPDKDAPAVAQIEPDGPSRDIYPQVNGLVEDAEAGGNSFKSQAISRATNEWNFFGNQQYDVDGRAIKIGRKEQEDGFYQRIGVYWLDGTGTHGVDGLNIGMPWSAAFTSWIMKMSGAEDRFRYSTLHAVFIYQAIRDRLSSREAAGYWGWRLNEQKPAVGDIVCWGREPGIDYDNQQQGNYHGHSDIVVSVEADKVWIIGGNVGNSVTKRPLPLRPDGYLFPIVVNGENLFALMQCRIDSPANLATPPAALQADAISLPSGRDRSSAMQIAWGKVLDPALKAKIIEVAQGLQCDPNHLVSAMAFETGQTFSPKIQNRISKATGLIQFMPTTARDLGTSIEQLAGMNAVRQMDFVAKYFERFTGKLRGLSDVYMAILWPAAVGDSDSTTLFARGSVQYSQNSGLDVNSDGIITKGEAASKVQAMLDKGLGMALIG
ncbi:DUF2272 domain-containing protein [Phyllobacterium chamaecytisi]|uniref:DUF2272 domain-containing protein n=1 Tax=Phyllobacterium chamaecytisi TaxID=2876082 RepID=UPI001CCD1C50|nr:DUF2272 domain-containing protein [Phyllobacterium sp. KW56]MBZ9603314.1 DUF2272 domain-containing protein [Phyllobacterium sp. KW56]